MNLSHQYFAPKVDRLTQNFSLKDDENQLTRSKKLPQIILSLQRKSDMKSAHGSNIATMGLLHIRLKSQSRDCDYA